MTSRTIRFLALSAIFVLTGSASATTYWVDIEHPNASDTSGHGLDPTSPFETIAYAATLVDPGDIVFVLGGTYPGRVLINRDGAPQQPIRFIGLEDDAAGVPSAKLIGPAVANRAFEIEGEYIDVENFLVSELAVQSSGAHVTIRGIHCRDGATIVAGRTPQGPGTHITIENCVVVGVRDESGQVSPSSGIALRGAEDSSILNNDVATCVNNIQCKESSWGVESRRVLIEGNRYIDSVEHGMFLSYTEDLTVRRNVGYGSTQGDAIYVAGIRNGTVANNTFVFGSVLVLEYTVTGFERPSTDILVSNNLVWRDPSPDNSDYLLAVDSASSPTFSSDYNLWFVPPASPPPTNWFQYDGVTYSDVPSFVAGTGHDSNSISADPEVVDAPGGDFNLTLCSPAVDAGDPGDPVPPNGGSRIDIGAFEFTDTTSERSPLAAAGGTITEDSSGLIVLPGSPPTVGQRPMGSSWEKRGFLKFDTSSVVPAGAEIEAVELLLDVGFSSASRPTVAAWSIETGDFIAGTIDAGDWSGSAIAVGSATWSNGLPADVSVELDASSHAEIDNTGTTDFRLVDTSTYGLMSTEWSTSLAPKSTLTVTFACGSSAVVPAMPAFSRSRLGPAPSPLRAMSISPQPMLRSGAIGFVLDASSSVTVDVFDASGRRVAKLAQGEFAAGRHDVSWSPSEHGLASGIYFARVRTPVSTLRQKIVVTR